MNAKQRKAVYQLSIAALTVTVAFGLFKPEQVNNAITQASQVVGIIASLLAVTNVTPDE